MCTVIVPEDMYTSIQCTDDSVQMDMKGTITVHMRFSPAFENYVKTVQALGALGPYARKPFEPSFVLERIAIYASQQCGKVTQAQMIANCMSLLSRFDQLRVVWSNYYDPSDVWSPLMLQKPLLMDP